MIKGVLLSPGKVASYSLLNSKGLFRKDIKDKKGKSYMKIVIDLMDKLKIGEVQCFFVPSNKSKV